jgi:hypothetical protein
VSRCICQERKLLEKILEIEGATSMSQQTQSFGLDLPYTLSSDSKSVAHFFERTTATVVMEAKSQLQYLPLALREITQSLPQLFLKQLAGGGLGRRRSVFILNEVSELAIVFLADGHVQRDRLLSGGHDLPDSFRWD